MPLTQGQLPDQSTIVQYLVGRAADADVAVLDELSIADDEFVVRLRAVEYDLLDAYVNGELTGPTLEGFRSQYLSSPSGLDKIALATALQGSARAPAADRPRTSETHVTPWRHRPWLAAAAAIVLTVLGYLLIDDVRLRRRVAEIRDQHAAVEQRERQLQEELRRQQSAVATATEELARAREALAASSARPADRPTSLLALLLSPATRGGGDVPSIAIPTDAATLTLRLQLAAVDFARYRVIVKEADSDRSVWRSGPLGAPAPGDRNVLSVGVRTTLLPPRAYTVELIGIPERGQAEPVDNFPFRVVAK